MKTIEDGTMKILTVCKAEGQKYAPSELYNEEGIKLKNEITIEVKKPT